MSKGWTRRPALVDRKAFDEAFERTFHGKQTDVVDGVLTPQNGIAPPCGDTVPRIRLHGPHPLDFARPEWPKSPPDGCEIADVMTQGFADGRSRA